MYKTLICGANRTGYSCFEISSVRTTDFRAIRLQVGTIRFTIQLIQNININKKIRIISNLKYKFIQNNVRSIYLFNLVLNYWRHPDPRTTGVEYTTYWVPSNTTCVCQRAYSGCFIFVAPRDRNENLCMLIVFKYVCILFLLLIKQWVSVIRL